MIQKRIIFTLIYQDGFFCHSRNFRLQKVGDINWLMKNYDFAKITYAIDELIILNTSKKANSFRDFCNVLDELSKGVFVPIASGGRIRDLNNVHDLFQSGADKIILNNLLFHDANLVRVISDKFGKQSIIGSLDFTKGINDKYICKICDGSVVVDEKRLKRFHNETLRYLGEGYITSIDRDGTGQGYDFTLLEFFPWLKELPIIYAGGVGRTEHLMEGLLQPNIHGVATANLFNFVGDGFINARKSLVDKKLIFPWSNVDDVFLTHD